jgi:hypothetical protein
MLDCVAEVLLDHAHGRYAVCAQCLDDLKGSHQAIFVNLLQHNVQLIACFVKNFRARGKVRKSGRIQLRLLITVFV